MHSWILPWYLAVSIFRTIPEHARSGVQSSACLLHDHTCYDVLEGSRQGLEILETVRHDVVRPFIDFLRVVGVLVQCVVNR